MIAPVGAFQWNFVEPPEGNKRVMSGFTAKLEGDWDVRKLSGMRKEGSLSWVKREGIS